MFADAASGHNLIAGACVQVWDAARFTRDGGLRANRLVPSRWNATVEERKGQWLAAVHPKAGITEMKISRINHVAKCVTFAPRWKVKIGRGKRLWMP